MERIERRSYFLQPRAVRSYAEPRALKRCFHPLAEDLKRTRGDSSSIGAERAGKQFSNGTDTIGKDDLIETSGDFGPFSLRRTR
jgi:hypothetical protein